MKKWIVLAVLLFVTVLVSGCARVEFEMELDGQGNEIARIVRIMSKEDTIPPMFIESFKAQSYDEYSDAQREFMEYRELNGPQWYGAEVVYNVKEALDSGVELKVSQDDASMGVIVEDDHFVVYHVLEPDPDATGEEMELYAAAELMIKVTVDNFTREYRFNFYDVLANGVNLYEKYTKR